MLRNSMKNERPLANGYETNELIKKKRIHETNHEFLYVAEFDEKRTSVSQRI